MSRILDQDPARMQDVAGYVEDLREHELGFEPQEMIPGLVLAILRLSLFTPDPTQVIDEVIEMLSCSEEELLDNAA